MRWWRPTRLRPPSTGRRMTIQSWSNAGCRLPSQTPVSRSSRSGAPRKMTDRAWCSSAGPMGLEHLARIEDAVRIEHALEAAHELERNRILYLWQRLPLELADAVLGEYRAVVFEHDLVDGVVDLAPARQELRAIGAHRLADVEVHIAV